MKLIPMEKNLLDLCLFQPARIATLKKFIFVIFILLFAAFSTQSHAEEMLSEPTFRAGFYVNSFSNVPLEDLKISLKVITEEIGKQMGIQASIVVFDDLQMLRKAFEKGDINFVAASSLQLVNEFDNNLFADGFRFFTSSELTDTLVVMTRKNEGLDDFKSLKGKRLALVTDDPVAELYVNVLSLENFKQESKFTFKELSNYKKPQQLILKLFFAQTDVICFYQKAYQLAMELNPQLNVKLQVIEKLEHMPLGLGFFHKNVASEFREKVIAEALRLESYTRGREILNIFRSDMAIRTTLGDLDGAKQLLANFQKLKNVKRPK